MPRPPPKRQGRACRSSFEPSSHLEIGAVPETRRSTHTRFISRDGIGRRRFTDGSHVATLWSSTVRAPDLRLLDLG